MNLQPLTIPPPAVSSTPSLSPQALFAPSPLFTAISTSPTPSPPPMPLDSQSLPDLVRRTTDKVEREVIARALDVVRWNRRRAARMLGVSYKTLLNKMKALGLDAEAPSELAE